MKKVAFCVPSTTNKREWSFVQDTYLWEILFTELQEKTPTDCEITVFVGYDADDKIYSQMEQRMSCNAVFDNFKIEWVEFKDNHKGHVTQIWNELAEVALLKGFEYMKIIGDDVTLPTDKSWLSAFINKLKKNDNIGFVAGYSNNDQIPTQFLVHKTHLDIFECKRYHNMPVVEKKPIVKTNENITEVKIMVKSLKYEVGSLKQDIKEMKELINKYISDQQELSKKGWLY